MTAAFLAFLGENLTRALGWMFIHSLWQGAIIAAGMFLAIRGRSPQTRYLAFCIALALLLGSAVCAPLA